MPALASVALAALVSLSSTTPSETPDAKATSTASKNAAAAKNVKPAQPAVAVVRHTRALYGTVVEIIASVEPNTSASDIAKQDAPFDAAFDEVRRIEAMVDEEDPHSPVARINQSAGKDAVVVDPELFFVLSELQRLAKLTKGAFDVTAAVYDDAWHFDDRAAPTRDPLGADAATPANANAATTTVATNPADAGPAAPTPVAAHAGVPDKSAIDKARALVGFDDLMLDPAARTAKLKTPGARIGTHSVARGYALERAATILEERGLHDFIVSASGDLVVRGDKGGRPWMVGVQDPRSAGHFAAFPSEPGAVMTTADYTEFFFDGGVRYHNVLDPRTGQPATKCRSVTVVAKDALTSEALSRAVFVLGAKDGMALVDRLGTVQAVVVTSDNKVVVSKGLRDTIQQRPPTDGP